jgi:hypothetical protein
LIDFGGISMFDRFWKHIKLIEFGVLSALIEFGVLSTDKYSRHIHMNKYPRHIQLIDESCIRRNKHPRHIQLIDMRILFGEIISKTYL